MLDSQFHLQLQRSDFYNIVKVSNGCWPQMANGHLGLGSNVQLGLVDFKVCDWPPETSLNGQSQIFKSCWPNFENPDGQLKPVSV